MASPAISATIPTTPAAAPPTAVPKADPAPTPTVPPRFVATVDVRPRSPEIVKRLRGVHPIETPAGVDGIAVVELPDLASAAAWAFAAAFAEALPREPDALALVDAPVPGAGLALGDDARVHAIVITRIGDTGSASPAWGRERSAIDAAAGRARATDLMVETAPLFAAPAATLPPAAERHALVPRTADVWTLGHVDRCAGDGAMRRCLHWAQVVARIEDRIVFGYLPAMWLATRDGWSPGPDRRPRAQLVRSGRLGADALLLLLARDPDGALHRRRVAIAVDDERWPAATLAVDGATATIAIAGRPAITLPLHASLDARPDDL